MFKGLSQVVSEELGGRGEAQTQSSVAAAAVEEPWSGGRGRERRPHSETHTDRHRWGSCNQLNCTARQGEWSSMLKSGAVKYVSEEVKQVMC